MATSKTSTDAEVQAEVPASQTVATPSGQTTVNPGPVPSQAPPGYNNPPQDPTPGMEVDVPGATRTATESGQWAVEDGKVVGPAR